MILLLEPRRPAAFVSGGYRYQHEVMQRLARRGEGELRAIDAADLGAAVAGAPGPVVVDGLFAELGVVDWPERAIALLHAVPSSTAWTRMVRMAIATSAATAQAVFARDVAVVRPGLDGCFVFGDARVPGERLRVACVGTVSAPKNQRLVAAALAALPDVASELVLLGDVKTEPDAARAVTAAAANVPVYFAGVVSPERVAAELHRADLFVSASRSESFGMAVAEAAACGTPVLAFATGEIDTFVHDGENGWLVDAQASDAEFTAQLHGLVRRPRRLATARERARRPQVWSWDDAASAFAAACRRVTGA